MNKGGVRLLLLPMMIIFTLYTILDSAFQFKFSLLELGSSGKHTHAHKNTMTQCIGTGMLRIWLNFTN